MSTAQRDEPAEEHAPAFHPYTLAATSIAIELKQQSVALAPHGSAGEGGDQCFLLSLLVMHHSQHSARLAP